MKPENQQDPENPGNVAQLFFGPKWHKYIGTEADKRLNDKARDAIAGILAPVGQSSLGEIANWADEIKGGGPKDDDTVQFLKAFPVSVNWEWHFVDLPLDIDQYDRNKYPQFTNNTDVVQMINNSVRILQGGAGKPAMSKINALRWLTHLVGDIHQPLHVACSYIDPNAKNPLFLKDPTDIIAKKLIDNHDQGGNLLIVPVNGPKPVTLHSYFDSGIPAALPDANTLKNINITKPGSNPDEWAAEWTRDAILKSRTIYSQLQLGTRNPKTKKYDVSWQSKSDFDKVCAPLITEQLAIGSERLGMLVNTIFV